MKVPLAHSTSWLGVFAGVSPLVLILVLNAWLAPGLFPAGALVWLVGVLMLREILTGAHRAGVRKVRRGEFSAAIPLFQQSYARVCQEPWIDRFRWPLLGGSSRWTYREIALCNTAFCYGQIGDGKQMREYYEKALSEFPASVLATTALHMIAAATPNSPAAEERRQP